MKSILIVIPTYNEALNIGNLIDIVQDELKGNDFSILVVDDNSQDETRDIVKRKLLLYKNIFLLYREQKLGLASAYIDGFKYGLANNYDYIIQMDADFSHNPKYLSTIIDKLSKYDVVIGSRNIKHGRASGWSFFRNLISKGGSIYSKIILSCPINDLTGGFNGWRSEILKNIGLDEIISKGYCFQIEMKYRAYKNNANIAEFPIIFENRKFGKSKMSKRIFLEALINVVKLKINLK